MLLKVTDADGSIQTTIVHGQEVVIDASGTIAATGTPQVLLAINAFRSGWVMQNIGSNPQYVNELSPVAQGPGAFKVEAGAFFPPANFPITGNIIQILGTSGDGFTCREW